MFRESNQYIGGAKEKEIGIEVFRLPNGGYTTWWKIGVSVFEVKEEDLFTLADLAEGAIEFIGEDKDELARR